MKHKRTENTSVHRNIREELLAMFRLDKQYIKGEKDYLYYEGARGESIEVLDLVGAYGINLLGHNCSEINNYAQELLRSAEPVFTQLSGNAHLSDFQNLFSTLLNAERQPKQWAFLHSNTGTESVEVALKTAWLSYTNRLNSLEQMISQSIFRIKKNYFSLAEIFSKELEIYSQKEALAYYDRLLERIKGTPFLLALNNAFHGKTAGALSATHSNKNTAIFPSAYSVVWLDEKNSLPECLEPRQIKLQLLYKKQDRLSETFFIPCFAFIFETIQGEGGLRFLDKEWLRSITTFLKSADIPLIADEIQSGLYRTGKLAATHDLGIEPDIYCFAKALGGRSSESCCHGG